MDNKISKLYFEINGKRYESLEEVPAEWRSVAEEFLEKVKRGEVPTEGVQRVRQVLDKKGKVLITSPLPENSVQLRITGAIFPIAMQIMSFVESQGLRVLVRDLGIVEMNFYLSLAIGFVSGHISYSLAKRNYENYEQKLREENIEVKYDKKVEFLKSEEITVPAFIYSFGFNLLFYALFYIAQYFKLF